MAIIRMCQLKRGSPVVINPLIDYTFQIPNANKCPGMIKSSRLCTNTYLDERSVMLRNDIWHS